MTADVMMLGRLVGEGHILVAAKHNKRTLYADGSNGSGIDTTRSHLNYSLAGPSAPCEVVALWKKLRTEAGISKPRRSDEVSAIEVVFSLPAGTQIDLREYFTACTVWAAANFGGENNLLSSDVHLDQTQPHCHVIILPLVNKKMSGSNLYWGESKNHQAQHNDFHSKVGSRYGLRKAQPKLSGAAKKAAAKQVHDQLNALHSDAERWKAILVAIFRAIDHDPGPFMAPLGIARDVQPEKTFKEIAMSTGAGPKTEAAQARKDAHLYSSTTADARAPVGFGGPPDDQTLSCVGFGQNSPPSALPTLHPVNPEQPITRLHDCDLAPDTWDSATGEFIAPRPPAHQYQRAAAQAFVASWLTDHGNCARATVGGI